MEEKIYNPKKRFAKTFSQEEKSASSSGENTAEINESEITKDKVLGPSSESSVTSPTKKKKTLFGKELGIGSGEESEKDRSSEEVIVRIEHPSPFSYSPASESNGEFSDGEFNILQYMEEFQAITEKLSFEDQKIEQEQEKQEIIKQIEEIEALLNVEDEKFFATTSEVTDLNKKIETMQGRINNLNVILSSHSMGSPIKGSQPPKEVNDESTLQIII